MTEVLKRTPTIKPYVVLHLSWKIIIHPLHVRSSFFFHLVSRPNPRDLAVFYEIRCDDNVFMCLWKMSLRRRKKIYIFYFKTNTLVAFAIFFLINPGYQSSNRSDSKIRKVTYFTRDIRRSRYIYCSGV